MGYSRTACISAFAVLLLAFNADAASVRVKRQSSNVSNDLESIPLLGPVIERSLQFANHMYKHFETITNVAAGRMFGGALPCTATTNGMSCKLVKKNTGITEMLLGCLRNSGLNSALGNGMLGNAVRSGAELIGDVLETATLPVADITFGGEPMIEAPAPQEQQFEIAV